MFGNVIGKGHCINESPGYIDAEIFWRYDEFGLVLGGFTPVENASDKLIEIYEKNK